MSDVKMPLGVVFMTSILDPEFCCKWKRILPEEEACVFSSLIQVLASIHTLIQLFTTRHTLIRLLTRLDDQITCYTHSMSHATTSITGRCQSSVECQKRGASMAISMSKTLLLSFSGQWKCSFFSFLLLDKRGELSEIEQFDNYNLFVTTQFGKEGSRRIVCHSPGKRPQVQQSTFFLPPSTHACKDLTSFHHHQTKLSVLSKFW